jgi:hypothetical protein
LLALLAAKWNPNLYFMATANSGTFFLVSPEFYKIRQLCMRRFECRTTLTDHSVTLQHPIDGRRMFEPPHRSWRSHGRVVYIAEMARPGDGILAIFLLDVCLHQLMCYASQLSEGYDFSRILAAGFIDSRIAANLKVSGRL